jgi:LPXTG-motif cell wall-anchored protein
MLPDTAMSATAPITLVGAMLVLAGGGLALRRRLA